MTEGKPAYGLIRRVGTNAGLLLSGKTVSGILALFYTALAVRALGIEDFGILTLLHAYTTLIAFALSAKTNAAILRYGTPLIAEGKHVAFRQLIGFTVLVDVAGAIVTAAIAALGVSVIAPIVGWTPPFAPWATAYAAVALFITRGRTPSGVLRLFDRFDLIAPQTAIEAVIRLTGAALAFLMGLGLPTLLAAWFLGRAARGVYLITVAYRELASRRLTSGFNLQWYPDTPNFRGIGRFVLTNSAQRSFGRLQRESLPLVIGALLGPASVGLFQIARQLAGAIAQPTKSLVPAIFPELARLISAGDIKRLKRLLLRSFALGITIATAGATILYFFGGWLLRLIGGTEAPQAYGLLLILVVARLTRVSLFPLKPLLVSLGHPHQTLFAQILGGTVLLTAVLALIPTVGLPGTGLAMLGSSLAVSSYQAIAGYAAFKRYRQRNHGKQHSSLPAT